MNWIIEIKTKFEPSQVKDDKKNKLKIVAAVRLMDFFFRRYVWSMHGSTHTSE